MCVFINCVQLVLLLFIMWYFTMYLFIVLYGSTNNAVNNAQFIFTQYFWQQGSRMKTMCYFGGVLAFWKILILAPMNWKYSSLAFLGISNPFLLTFFLNISIRIHSFIPIQRHSGKWHAYRYHDRLQAVQYSLANSTDVTNVTCPRYQVSATYESWGGHWSA